jgi:hypothetical protein
MTILQTTSRLWKYSFNLRQAAQEVHPILQRLVEESLATQPEAFPKPLPTSHRLITILDATLRRTAMARYVHTQTLYLKPRASLPVLLQTSNQTMTKKMHTMWASYIKHFQKLALTMIHGTMPTPFMTPELELFRK